MTTAVEDLITKTLDMGLGHSEPGDALHHLYYIVTKPGPLGLDLEKPEMTIAAIAPVYGPDEHPDTDTFIAKMIMAVTVKAYQEGGVIYFAALAQECNVVRLPPDKAERQRLTNVLAAGKLGAEPMAGEATRLYAACRDGRRWVGHQFLTGPDAGPKVGPMLRVGALSRDEAGMHPELVRKSVMFGLHPEGFAR